MPCYMLSLIQSGSYPGLVGPKESAADSVCGTEVAEELASFPGNVSQHVTAHSHEEVCKKKGVPPCLHTVGAWVMNVYCL